MEMNSDANMEAPITEKKSNARLLWIILIVVFLIIFYNIFGFFTIQPIGAIPDGVTLLVNRAGTQLKFFDSADAMCERTMGGVSLLCRLGALSAIAENEKMIVMRLPYMESLYLASTGGMTYDR